MIRVMEWREDYEHGTAAAAVGGYTTIIDMPLQNEPAMTTAEIMEKKIAKVDPNAYVDYCFWGGLIPDNFQDLKGLDEKDAWHLNLSSDLFLRITLR